MSSDLIRQKKSSLYGLSLYIFLADQISFRSYVGSGYRMRSIAFSGFSFMFFRTVGLFRSDTLRFFKYGTGHAVECF